MNSMQLAIEWLVEEGYDVKTSHGPGGSMVVIVGDLQALPSSNRGVIFLRVSGTQFSYLDYHETLPEHPAFRKYLPEISDPDFFVSLQELLNRSGIKRKDGV